MSIPGSNPYFPTYTCTSEQDLLMDLNQELIKINGMEVFYIPRTLISYDQVYGEDDISEYTKALSIEMYLKTVNGFEGDGVFLAKFGLEIRDQVIFTLSRKSFFEVISDPADRPDRPFEGDLIYYPLNQKLFQIMFVDYLPMHYPLGKLQTWDLTCELFEYSNQLIDTGIAEIDEIQTKFTTNILDFVTVDENGNYVVDENGNYLVSTEYGVLQSNVAGPTSDTTVIQDEGDANNILDWSEVDPFSSGFY